MINLNTINNQINALEGLRSSLANHINKADKVTDEIRTKNTGNRIDKLAQKTNELSKLFEKEMNIISVLESDIQYEANKIYEMQMAEKD